MKITILKTENDYEKALERIDELLEINPEENTSLSDELDLLVLLVEKYEEINWKINIPNPIETTKYRMEEMNLQQKI